MRPCVRRPGTFAMTSPPAIFPTTRAATAQGCARGRDDPVAGAEGGHHAGARDFERIERLVCEARIADLIPALPVGRSGIVETSFAPDLCKTGQWRRGASAALDDGGEIVGPGAPTASSAAESLSVESQRGRPSLATLLDGLKAVESSACQARQA